MTDIPQEKTRILLVDDHPMIRERLVELIEREADFEVCGEAEDRHEALDLVAAVHPHLAIVDLTLKSSLGMELIKDLQARYPEVKVLVVSMQDEMIYAERCIHAGARGYITKQQASRHVMKAIRHVLSGGIYLSEAMTHQVLERSMRKNSSASREPLEIVSKLADRELQVFELVGKGLSTRQIADLLFLDTKTIETYRSRIKEKLGLKDGPELLQRAIAWVHRNTG
ncbi:response regulator transcription factor [Luteolibacter flavescens]|uniref:Response regulator transcription factor n=1 Tax=Luteolibacter flavescens TaxID=1859460 RepID=A0ABT3FNK7_9BACT|nr:response regulator transcription factor [Luteolibacter flavescens]MCW1885155.1 response regulator transcription factor [Luteolibacter flavescens]